MYTHQPMRLCVCDMESLNKHAHKSERHRHRKRTQRSRRFSPRIRVEKVTPRLKPNQVLNRVVLQRVRASRDERRRDNHEGEAKLQE
jgi:hypothetical protein